MLGLFFSECMMVQCLRSVKVLMWLQEATWGSFPIAHISEERIIVIMGEENPIVQFRTKLWSVLAGAATSILCTCWRYIPKHWSEITCLKIIFKGHCLLPKEKFLLWKFPPLSLSFLLYKRCQALLSHNDYIMISEGWPVSTLWSPGSIPDI